MGLKMAKFKPEADFIKSLFFLKLAVKTSSNKMFRVLKAGFLFLNFPPKYSIGISVPRIKPQRMKNYGWVKFLKTRI